MAVEMQPPAPPVRRLAPAVEWRAPASILIAALGMNVMRISLSSSPACGCGALPQPRSSRALAADTRAAAGAALEPQTPVSVRMASAVCARAKDRISAVP